MKKYTKPEIQIVSFDVESVVMTSPAATPIMAQAASNGSVLSVATSDYIPTDIDNKVWSNVDGENWNWTE